MDKYQYKFEIEKLPTEADVKAEFGKIMFELKDFNKTSDMGALIARELMERVIKHIKLSVKTNDLFTEVNSLWISASQYGIRTFLSDAGEQKKACDCTLILGIDTQQDGFSCAVSGCKCDIEKKTDWCEILEQREIEINVLKNHFKNIEDISIKNNVFDKYASAKATLEYLGYTYHGGPHWKPPMGKNPFQP